MANSARSMLGPHADPYLYYPLWHALDNDVRVKLLLLDPTSEAARYRARIEEPETSDRDFPNTHLYKDAVAVARTLEDPDSDWVRVEALRQRIKDRTQVQVRYSSAEPTTYLIILGDMVFFEQYHTGGGQEIEETLLKRGLPRLYCFGGFVNVIMYERTSVTGTLLQSHFENSWERAKELSLEQIRSYPAAHAPARTPKRSTARKPSHSP